MLTTPLVASAMPARDAIGLILPLLCVADVLTMGFYWKQWDWKAIRELQIGGVIGIGLGMFFVSRVSNNSLSLAIGIVGLIMAILLVVRERWYPDHVYSRAWSTASWSASRPDSRRRSRTPPGRSSPSTCSRSGCRSRRSSPPTRSSSP